ncbi:MAG: TonB-dependent receptor, partial [Pseudohongiella sp.]
PTPPAADDSFAQPWTHTDEDQLFGVVRGEYDLSDAVSVWAAAGLRDGEENNVLANPNADAQGNTSAYRFDNARADKIHSGELGIRTTFDTAALGHNLSLTASAFSLESRNAYAFSSFAGFPGNLYDPVTVSAPQADFFVGGSLSSPRVTEEVETSSVAIADMISLLDERMLVTVGARYQNIETRSFDYNTGSALSSYDEGRLTPVFGIVYKTSEQVSLYGNYIEGLVPGEVAPTNSGGSPVLNAGEVFEPYQSEQFELGAKYDGGDLGGSVSAFTTSRPSSYVENAVFAPQGEQRNRGVELSLFGTLTQNVRLLGGATWLEAEMVDTQGGQFDGNDAVGAPDTQLNVNLEWDVPALPGLTLDARHIYTSSQYANAANTIEVAAWNRTDLGARYRTRIAERDVTL